MALIVRSTPAPPSPSTPPSEQNTVEDRVSAAFQRLTQSAATLNVVSDELGKPVTAIEAALKKLNLGVSTWVETAGQVEHETGQFWHRGLGYAKVSGRWGIAIRTMSGSLGDVDPFGEEWLFNDAPRAFRLEAADHFPELLEKLVAAADETAAELKQKIDGVRQVAHAVAVVLTANSGPRK